MRLKVCVSDKAQKNRQSAADRQHLFFADMAESDSDAIPWNGLRLVHHHLRGFLQSVRRVAFDANPEQGGFPQISGDWQYRDGRVLVEQVGLDDQCGSGISVVAL